jgi:hypothetical protein
MRWREDNIEMDVKGLDDVDWISPLNSTGIYLYHLL